ncbi:MAG: hypothetical protein RIR51_1669 [Bacteroidota bacterium]|jgi:large subunit ribosomal protein L29
MKNAEIKSLGKDELVKKIAEEKENLSRLQLAHSISPIENPLRIREAKRVIARLLTQLNSLA